MQHSLEKGRMNISFSMTNTLSAEEWVSVIASQLNAFFFSSAQHVYVEDERQA